MHDIYRNTVSLYSRLCLISTFFGQLEQFNINQDIQTLEYVIVTILDSDMM